jgi:hypothetical protein
MKIVKLDIDENAIFGGIDAVALVEYPAIEEDFYMFSQPKEKFAETYNDYPQKAIANAKRGIELNLENDNKCATQVGKVRAQQLANGEKLSLDTIRRMRSFLIRQKDNYELALKRKDYNACGYISYLLWGGAEALPWAEKKLRQAGEEFDLDEACQPGYKAIGLKTKNGRKVPNCVPEANFEAELEKVVVEQIIKDHLFSQVDNIDGVPVFSTPEEAEAKAKEIGCSGYHEHTTPEGLKTYMPCSHHGTAIETLQDNVQREFNADVSALPNYVNELPEDIQDRILNELENVGVNSEALLEDGWIEIDKEDFYKQVAFAITSSPDKSSISDFGGFAVRYRYKGPFDSRNRTFCRQLMSKDLVFRKEDINNLSIQGENEEFGIYDIFRYKGSYNCRHYWQEVFYKRDSDITDDKKPLAISQRILDATTRNLPVIQKDGVADRETFAAYEELDDKQIVVGPLMTPFKMIRRVDNEGKDYFVYFDDDGIERLAYKMMKEKLIDRVKIEHYSNDMVEDAYLVESWIVKDPENDKSRFYGYEPVRGQWFGMYKIEDKNIWQEYVKTGKVKGFSVEGFFGEKVLSASKVQCRKTHECACGKTGNTDGMCDGSHSK